MEALVIYDPVSSWYASGSHPMLNTRASNQNSSKMNLKNVTDHQLVFISYRCYSHFLVQWIKTSVSPWLSTYLTSCPPIFSKKSTEAAPSVSRSMFVAEQSKIVQLYHYCAIILLSHTFPSSCWCPCLSVCLSFPLCSIPLFLPSSTAPSHRMLRLPENKRRSMERDKAEGGR